MRDQDDSSPFIGDLLVFPIKTILCETCLLSFISFCVTDRILYCFSYFYNVCFCIVVIYVHGVFTLWLLVLFSVFSLMSSVLLHFFNKCLLFGFYVYFAT